ncbi:MAG TPA: hypothetical protein VMY18_11645 [Acidobacteriota bacterium]|nr:hypothetical protein [Acidobacteriota bacterium]
MAQPFDDERLEVTGEPIPIVEGLRSSFDTRNFSVSENGVLVYRSTAATSRLRWWDRAGRRLDSVVDPGEYSQIALSPDEKYVSVEHGGDIWLLELSSGVFSRFTVDPAVGGDAVWSPDSQQLLFTSHRKGPTNLFVKSIGGSEAELLFEEEAFQFPEDWSPDGGQAIYLTEGGTSVYGLDVRSPERKPRRLFVTDFSTEEHRVSPDGHWIVYSSMESGKWEIHLATFPDFARIRQVSVGGGTQPQWRRDGTELFYLSTPERNSDVRRGQAGSRYGDRCPADPLPDGHQSQTTVEPVRCDG